MNLPSLPLRRFGALRLLWATLLPLAALAGQLHAASYYVDYAAGADTQAGTSTTSAWKHSPGDPAATGAAATTNLAAGDTVYFKGGVTYVFTGDTGIVLRWNGAAGKPITYDGNSAGNWGSGRARFTDQHGAKGITAFSAQAAAAHLVFKHLEFTAIGGAATAPADTGAAVAPRFGGGLAFNAGVTAAQIEGCVFRDLGYAFNTKPMNAASISGQAIAASRADGLQIGNCTFSRVGVAVALRQATAINALEIEDCVFGEAIVWSLDLPPGDAGVTNLSISGSSEATRAHFDAAGWSGYGPGPRTVNRMAQAGTSVTFNASAVATPDASYQWRKDGAPIAGATGATLALNAVSAADAGTYTVIATNAAGSSASNAAVLTVASDAPPVFTVQPADQSGAPLSQITLTAAATGSPAPTYRWYRNGVTFAPWNQPTLTLRALTSNDVGTYVVVATNAGGSVTSRAARVTLASNPVDTTTPTGGTSTGSTPGTSSPSNSGSPGSTPAPAPTVPQDPAPTVPPAPAPTTPTVPDDPAPEPAPTVPTVPVTPQDPAPEPAEPDTPATPSASRLVNLSVRSTTGEGSDTLIVGFVLAGETGKPLLIRGNGPALVPHGIDRPVPNPRLTLFSAANPIAANDDWNASANAADLAATAARCGAFPLPAASRDAALLTTLAPGVYTAQVTGSDGNGTALVELYDAATDAATRLVNLSARSVVSRTNVPIVGFVVAGEAPKRLLVRAIGPGLAPLGVAQTLADPRFQIISNGSVVLENDNWGGGGELRAEFERVGAFALGDPASKDAAAVFTAPPGVYTVVVGGPGETTGTVLVEVYELP